MASDVAHMPISRLSSDAHNILNRLNAKRLFQTDGLLSLPRDYRGLAGLVGISTQDAEILNITTVLDMWLQRQPLNAVVHQLFRHLETIDRFDIRDDLRSLAEQGRLVTMNAGPVAEQRMVCPQNDEMLTEDDLEAGVPVLYDAVILYAEEDTAFVNAVSEVLTEIGFRLFNKHSLRLGVMELSAMAELMSTRCRYSILMISPAFSKNHVTTRDNQFYSKYAHAHTIAEKTHRMILCILDECEVPLDLKHYTMLEVRKIKIFWRRLVNELNNSRKPRLSIPSWVRSNNQPPNSLAANVVTSRSLAAVGASSASVASGPVHGQFRLLLNPHEPSQCSNQPASSTAVQPPTASVPSAYGSVNNLPNWSFINGQVTNESIASSVSTVSNSHAITIGHSDNRVIFNDEITNGSLINDQSTNASVASGPAHGQFRLLSNPYEPSQCSNQPASSTVVQPPNASVPNACGFFYNLPSWSFINGQVTNESIASSASTVSNSHAIVIGHSDDRIISNDQIANGSIIDGQSTNVSTPNGQIANASVGNIYECANNSQHNNWSFSNSPVSNEPPTISQVSNSSVANYQIVANSPVSCGSIASGQPSCSSVANSEVANARMTDFRVATGSAKVEMANGHVTYQPVANGTDNRINQPSNEYVVNIKVVSERIVPNPNAYASNQDGIGQSSTPSHGSNDQLSNGDSSQPAGVHGNRNSIVESLVQLFRTRTWSVRNMLPRKRARTVQSHAK